MNPTWRKGDKWIWNLVLDHNIFLVWCSIGPPCLANTASFYLVNDWYKSFSGQRDFEPFSSRTVCAVCIGALSCRYTTPPQGTMFEPLGTHGSPEWFGSRLPIKHSRGISWYCSPNHYWCTIVLHSGPLWSFSTPYLPRMWARQYRLSHQRYIQDLHCWHLWNWNLVTPWWDTSDQRFGHSSPSMKLPMNSFGEVRMQFCIELVRTRTPLSDSFLLLWQLIPQIP